jgi:hypothetical protein
VNNTAHQAGRRGLTSQWQKYGGTPPSEGQLRKLVLHARMHEQPSHSDAAMLQDDMLEQLPASLRFNASWCFAAAAAQNLAERRIAKAKSSASRVVRTAPDLYVT